MKKVILCLFFSLAFTSPAFAEIKYFWADPGFTQPQPAGFQQVVITANYNNLTHSFDYAYVWFEPGYSDVRNSNPMALWSYDTEQNEWLLLNAQPATTWFAEPAYNSIMTWPDTYGFIVYDPSLGEPFEQFPLGIVGGTGSGSSDFGISGQSLYLDSIAALVLLLLSGLLIIWVTRKTIKTGNRL